MPSKCCIALGNYLAYVQQYVHITDYTVHIYTIGSISESEIGFGNIFKSDYLQMPIF